MLVVRLRGVCRYEQSSDDDCTDASDVSPLRMRITLHYASERAWLAARAAGRDREHFNARLPAGWRHYGEHELAVEHYYFTTAACTRAS